MNTKNIYLIMIIALIMIASSILFLRKDDEVIYEYFGEYKFKECSYLSVLSSSTMDYKTMINTKNSYLLISKDEVRFKKDGMSYQFDEVQYINVDVSWRLDESIKEFSKGFVDKISLRFDIYTQNGFSLYSVLVGDKGKIYFAEFKESKDEKIYLSDAYELSE